MLGSRNFFQGGGGSRLDGQKTVLTSFFFSPQLILQFTEGVQWFYLLRKLYFSKDPEGVQHFPGGSNFFRGGGGGGGGSKCLFL